MTTATHDPRPATGLPTALQTPGASGAPWLDRLRRAAAEQFNVQGLPTRRDEEWRLTSLKPLERTAFLPMPPDVTVDRATIDALALPPFTTIRLVFVNGRYRGELSSVDCLPGGVVVASLADSLDTHGELLEQHLGRYADGEKYPFTAFNTASIRDGAVVHVPPGTTVRQPIYVLSVSTAPDGAVVTHPRNLVVAEEGSRVTVVEDYVCPGADVYLTNAVTEAVVGPEADVHHYLVERESPRAFNISTLRVQQQRDSRFASHSLLLGGALVRNNVNPVLDGEHCHSLLNGLYVGAGKQHLDNHMRVEHARPHCDSRQYYKGILTDEAHGVFSGRIVVVQDAQKTDAVQSNASLLLSESARANAKPQLEIYADDVKCTHGATIGELDDEALFYLSSRGLDEATARGVLVYAFAHESIDRMEPGPLRDALEGLLLERLPAGDVLRAVLA